MRNQLFILAATGTFAMSSLAFAQTTRPAHAGSDYANSPLVTHMMRFDTRHNGKLTRDEITDDRLLRLFDEADANKDGIVTRDELIAIAVKLDSQVASDSGGPGGPDGGRGMGFGGFGGPGGGRGMGRGGPPAPGQILPPGLQNELGLTDQQKSELQTLQNEVDAQLAKILTPDQQQQLKQMSARGRGGPGGFGGRGGPGGGGGPDGFGPPPEN
jgi:Spy/CpxP family protein refolding chaperone